MSVLFSFIQFYRFIQFRSIYIIILKYKAGTTQEFDFYVHARIFSNTYFLHLSCMYNLYLFNLRNQ